MESLQLSSNQKRLEKILDAFLFCCYTGLRFSDFVSLKTDELITQDGKTWISKYMLKTSITLDQESRVLSLYKDGMAIKEIMKETDIKSEQTIYRILDSNGVPRRPKVNGVKRILVMIEEDVAAILDKEQSVSLYVNEAIRYYHGNRH